MRNTAAAPHAPVRSQPRLFTPRTANATLVLVRRVVQDIVDRYAELMRLRAQRAEAALEHGAARRADELRGRCAVAAAALSRLHQELTEIGCELMDWTDGYVDFPALHQGRPIRICWQLGEPEVRYWHAPNGGFSARRPIGPDFES